MGGDEHCTYNKNDSLSFQFYGDRLRILSNMWSDRATTYIDIDESGYLIDYNYQPPTMNNNGLFIEMIDGNVKQAQKIDLTDFMTWYKNRDLDKIKRFY